MTDRGKVIEALQYLISRECTDTQFDYLDEIEAAIVLLKEQETANLYKCQNCGTWVSAENVVRCKDCKYARRMCQPCNNLMCEKNRQANKPDWFCADGERKEGW